MNPASRNNWFKKAPGELPRYEVHLSDIAYSPHRHESYTIALTLQGVQSFQYRGKKNASLPGQVIVLHPDEIHDGQAGTEAGFTYRSFHINPELIHKLTSRYHQNNPKSTSNQSQINPKLTSN